MMEEKPTEKLHKVLARAGVASRRACEALIEQGRVTVNGIPATVGDRVSAKDDVRLDGERVGQPADFVYVLLHKPRGYITTARDPQGRPTVLDLLGDLGVRVYPVGRLDGDTTGLLLLTNDGDLANAVMHPRGEVHRVYRALVEGAPDAPALQRLRDGVQLDDGLTAPARVAVVARRGSRTLLELEIHEGRNRQVRRMCEAVGHRVVRLHRVRLGPITLESLPEGHWRFLTPAELKQLREAAALPPKVYKPATLADRASLDDRRHPE